MLASRKNYTRFSGLRINVAGLEKLKKGFWILQCAKVFHDRMPDFIILLFYFMEINSIRDEN